MKDNRYTVSFLHVSALQGCHHQGILMLTQAAPPNRSNVLTKNTQTHHFQ